MSESYYESRIKQHTRSLNSDRRKQSDEERKAASAESEVARLLSEIGRSNSASQRSSKQRRIDSKRKDAAKAREAAAKASRSVSDTQKKLGEAEAKLTEARATRQRQDQRRDQQEQRRRDREQQQAERDRTRLDAEHGRQVADLSSRAASLEAQVREAQRKLAPPEITVLFLASSPEDQEPLRLDKEAREIEQRLRATEYRDSITFAARTARQLTDLIQDLNEVEPHVVHFSGHGSQQGLAFEDAEGNTKPMSNELLAQLLTASSGRIRLAVFNSCLSATQAEVACKHVDLAVGMSASVGDGAAKTFAAQFYNSLGFGHSVGTAFDQAKTQVALEHGDGHEIPQLFAAPEVDPMTVVLVDPEGESSSAAA